VRHVLSIDALSVKITRIILRKIEAKIFRSDFSFVSNFLKMIRVILTESASIERTLSHSKNRKNFVRILPPVFTKSAKEFLAGKFWREKFLLAFRQVCIANACVNKILLTEYSLHF
jgi:hypothetical protein